MNLLIRFALNVLAGSGVLIFLALAGVLFSQAATPVTVVFLLVAGVSGSVALLAIFGRSRWAHWATIGAWPGSLLGGTVAAAILLGSYRSDGWSVLIIGVSLIIVGMLIGGFIGAFTGGLLGARSTCRANSTG
jgi:hypothetical protein